MLSLISLKNLTGKAAFVSISFVLFLTSASTQQRQSHREMGHHNTAGGLFERGEEHDWAKAQLANPPRHQDWVKVKYENREVNSFVVYPESKKKATAVIVIHEINRMTDWVQSLTDQLAEAGYVALGPDFLSGMVPGGGGTASFIERNAVGQAIRDLPPDQITADLNAVADYIANVPASNGNVVVSGFCWEARKHFVTQRTVPRLKLRSVVSKHLCTAFMPAMMLASTRRCRRSLTQ